MAESIVQINEGSGKKLHTFQRVIGANTVEDEVIIFGENYLASYTVAIGSISTATAASHVIQIMAGASLKVRIRRIELWLNIPATAAALALVDVLRLTTAGTGGTVVTPGVLDPGDAASGATAMTLPTVKGTEGTLICRAEPYMLQTVAASMSTFGPLVVWDFDRPRSKPLIIAAGATNGICVKWGTAIAAGAITGTVWIDESNF